MTLVLDAGAFLAAERGHGDLMRLLKAELLGAGRFVQRRGLSAVRGYRPQRTPCGASSS